MLRNKRLEKLENSVEELVKEFSDLKESIKNASDASKVNKALVLFVETNDVINKLIQSKEMVGESREMMKKVLETYERVLKELDLAKDIKQIRRVQDALHEKAFK